MGNTVKPLNDSALVKVAAYYASLEPAATGGRRRQSRALAKPDPVQAGKTAAAACAGCHGDTGISKIPGTPSLVGLDPKYLVAAMKAYKSGQRKNDTMKSMLSRGRRCRSQQHRALLRACKSPQGRRRRAGGDQAAGKQPRRPAPGAMATRASAAIPRFPAWPDRMRDILRPRCMRTRTASRGDETMNGSGSLARRAVCQEYGGLLRQSAAAADQRAEAADDGRMGAAMRPLPWRLRQQHRSASARAGSPASSTIWKRFCTHTGRRAQEPADGGDVRGTDGNRRRQSLRPTTRARRPVPSSSSRCRPSSSATVSRPIINFSRST